MNQVLRLFLTPLSAVEYWGLSALTMLWHLGELFMIREILLSLLAGDYSRSKRRKIYQSQPLFRRLSLFFVKGFLKTKTYQRLFAPYYALYLAEACVFVVYTVGLFALPSFMGYRLLPIGIKTVTGILCLIFLRTKYPHGFGSAPKYSYGKSQKGAGENSLSADLAAGKPRGVPENEKGAAMWEFRFYALWDLERVERDLEQMAARGLVVEKIRFFHWFCFRDEKPRRLTFFFPYTAPKDSGMLDYERSIQKTPNASRVDGGNLLYMPLYQMPEAPPFLEEATAYRRQYIRKVIQERLKFDLFLLLVLFACCCAERFLPVKQNTSVIYVCIGLFFAARAVWHRHGLRVLNRRSSE